MVCGSSAAKEYSKKIYRAGHRSNQKQKDHVNNNILKHVS